MTKAKKSSFSISFIRICSEEESKKRIKRLIKPGILKVLEKHGAVSTNLDEVLDKYIVAPNTRCEPF
ncbi:hypothetical protein [Paenibacillus sp. AR247]|uniref:hypothetical protein n=1 Tax=Paenibacillus sp. AR247 TaxID=1631599 RepID=UPI000CF9A203|nr:hypothetical protein [Paenibacillus sp. AR247]PQP89681.1 hypothetical protein CPT76_16940 [Paenibacillus sp. AR247]